jgi:CRISPR/Cas system-associated exonuclease Cas4 (RecB family)
MIEGAKLHEEQAQELLSQMQLRKVKAPETVVDALVLDYAAVKHAIASRSCLVNSEEGTMYASILPELGCVGITDLVDCSNGSPVVVEKKFVSTIPYRPWPDQELQLAVYMLSLERIGFSPTHGVLEYHQRGTDNQKRFEVCLDDYLRKKIENTIEAVRAIIERDEAPIPTKKVAKCRACKYVKECRWKLV